MSEVTVVTEKTNGKKPPTPEEIAKAAEPAPPTPPPENTPGEVPGPTFPPLPAGMVAPPMPPGTTLAALWPEYFRVSMIVRQLEKQNQKLSKAVSGMASALSDE